MRYRTPAIDGSRIKIGEHWFGLGAPGPRELFDVDGQYLKTCFHGNMGEIVTYVKAKGHKGLFRKHCRGCGSIWYDRY